MRSRLFSPPGRTRLYAGLPLLLLLLLLGLWALPGTRSRLLRVVSEGKRVAHHFEPAHTEWETASPEAEGLDGGALDALRRELESRRTRAFLVVRGNRLVYEWYPLARGPNAPHYTASLAKGVAASLALLVALGDSRLGLDDPASAYIPSWRKDSLRARIRIRDLLFHSSGVTDVDFVAGAAGRLSGWRARYYRNPAERFRLAIGTAPIEFAPGTRYAYSGVGYYALAYALTAALRGTEQTDVRALLAERVMRPLGVPDEDWRLSYGESYQIDGMRLYALGSGGSYTARAEARVGQLLLDRGEWEGRRLLERRWVDALLTRDGAAPYVATEICGRSAGCPEPPPGAPGGGWWLNLDGAWPSLPPDAFAAIGGGHQVLLVVPSLDLVAVRQGEMLSSPGEGFGTALRRHFFVPLAGAVTGPGSRR
ncbi:MAG: serine hydrolase domain-containing protein [Gemmatimonadota bacterium]